MHSEFAHWSQKVKFSHHPRNIHLMRVLTVELDARILFLSMSLTVMSLYMLNHRIRGVNVCDR